MKTFGFPKAEHLCLRRDIETLFSPGSKSLSVFPVRVIFRPVGEKDGPAVRVLLSVSKRKLRHAVDRNRAKRQLREAYRHNKQLLLSALPAAQHLHVGFIWLSERPVPSTRVQTAVERALRQVAEKLQAEVPAVTEETAEKP